MEHIDDIKRRLLNRLSVEMDEKVSRDAAAAVLDVLFILVVVKTALYKEDPKHPLHMMIKDESMDASFRLANDAIKHIFTAAGVPEPTGRAASLLLYRWVADEHESMLSDAVQEVERMFGQKHKAPRRTS